MSTLGDLKERLTRIEGMDLGSAKFRDERLGDRADSQGSQRNNVAILSAMIAGLACLAALVMAAVVLLRNGH
jgi:hypothetical protein